MVSKSGTLLRGSVISTSIKKRTALLTRSQYESRSVTCCPERTSMHARVCHTRQCRRPNFRSLSGVPIAIATIGSHQLFSPSEVRIISRGTPHKWLARKRGPVGYAGEAPFGVAPLSTESH